MPKSYRSVALIGTLAKLLEAVVATRIMYTAEEHRLLPDTHLGGRKGISIEYMMQQQLDRIHQAWRIGKVVSIILLDIAGAWGSPISPILFLLFNSLLLRACCNNGLGRLLGLMEGFG